MLRRQSTIFLVAVILTISLSLPLGAQNDDKGGLKGITAIYVGIETLPRGVEALGLTEEAIRTDIELKLRLAGMRVATQDEWLKMPGSPFLYAKVDILNDGSASYIGVAFAQDARLVRNAEFASSAITWNRGGILRPPTAQSIRDHVKDLVDEFLNAWLSVNPKK